MASLRIVDASPLILLGKIGRLDLLREEGREVLVPDVVSREVDDPTAPGQTLGLDVTLTPFGIEADVTVPAEVARFALDPGESMVLAVALSRRAGGDDVEVVLDKWRRRRAARALDLPLIGTAGLLLRAKIEGRIDAVAPRLDDLQRRGMYLGDELRREILTLAGE